MTFGTGFDVYCWEGGVFNRSCFRSVSYNVTQAFGPCDNCFLCGHHWISHQLIIYESHTVGIYDGMSQLTITEVKSTRNERQEQSSKRRTPQSAQTKLFFNFSNSLFFHQINFRLITLSLCPTYHQKLCSRKRWLVILYSFKDCF